MYWIRRWAALALMAAGVWLIGLGAVTPAARAQGATTTTTIPPATLPPADCASGKSTAVLNPSDPTAGQKAYLYGQCFTPGASVTATEFSTPVVLGSFPADSDGKIAATVIMPSTLDNGPHRIELRGPGGGGTHVATALWNLGGASATTATTAAAGASGATGGLATSGSRSSRHAAAGAMLLVVGAILLLTSSPRTERPLGGHYT